MLTPAVGKRMGNTPTGVGTTTPTTTRSCSGEHPHGRGDDIAARKASCPLIGEGKAGICCDGHLDRLALASPAWALVAEEERAGVQKLRPLPGLLNPPTPCSGHLRCKGVGGSPEQVKQWAEGPLEDLVTAAGSYAAASDGLLQNVLAVVQARSAIASRDAAAAAKEAASAARWAALTAAVLAVATVALAIVTALR